jgi:hypothetical protein
MVTVTKEENQATMVWLEEGLQRARDREQAKLAGLLEAVRADIALELEFAEASLAHR